MPPTISFRHKARKAARCTNLLATVLKYTVPMWLCLFLFFFIFFPVSCCLVIPHLFTECLPKPASLFSFGSAEIHFRFECNPKHRQPHAIPGTFWQVLAQLDSWDLSRAHINWGRPFDPFYLVGVRG